MRTLNLDNFNEILLNAIPKEKAKELLEVELCTAYGLKIQAMEELVECLNSKQKMPYRDILDKINNINNTCDYLREQIEARTEEGDENNNVK